eukprot:2494783-Rhodomonas_salina.1
MGSLSEPHVTTRQSTAGAKGGSQGDTCFHGCRPDSKTQSLARRNRTHPALRSRLSGLDHSPERTTTAPSPKIGVRTIPEPKDILEPQLAACTAPQSAHLLLILVIEMAPSILLVMQLEPILKLLAAAQALSVSVTT